MRLKEFVKTKGSKLKKGSEFGTSMLSKISVKDPAEQRET